MKTIKLTANPNIFKQQNDSNKDIEKRVAQIIENIKKDGDKSLFEFTKQFDGVLLTPKTVKVSKQEITAAAKLVTADFKKTALKIKHNVETYYKEEKKYLKALWTLKSKHKILGQKTTPIETVGVYIPGGTAPLISTVFMTVIPAKIAGVKKIIAVSPPAKDAGLNPYIIYTLTLLGITDIYKVGGAQAIAALAIGTKSIPKVDKIAGPGNIYVATAKKQLLGTVGIDMIAGPSEVMILADSSAKPQFIAADILSQAEHDRLSRAILVTTSAKLAAAVTAEVKKQIKLLSRQSIAAQSIKDFGLIVLVNNLQQGIDLVNQYAPEHLELQIKNHLKVLPKIINAGAVFLGNYTPVSCGDFIAGPSHVLPTAGSAKFSSYLSIESFMKKSSFTYYSKELLTKEAKDIITIAELEGLDAHANSIKIRLENF